MSITDIEYNPESHSLEIVIKFFTDDLEKALEEKWDQRILLATEKEASNTDSLLKVYLASNFSIKQANQIKSMDFIGKESERDYTWVYIECKDYDPESTIWLENKLLIELFEEQANRINFKNNSYSKSVTLHKNLTGAQF